MQYIVCRDESNESSLHMNIISLVPNSHMASPPVLFLCQCITSVINFISAKDLLVIGIFYPELILIKNLILRHFEYAFADID